jgi:hypothetical protein
MDISIHIRNVRSLLPLSLALMATAATAQTVAPSQADSTGVTLPAKVVYQSPISGYQPYVDQPVQSWREANDRVGRIGGWRAYAKEAAAGESAKETPAVDAHSGHHGGTKP